MNGHESSRKPRKTLTYVKHETYPNLLRLQFKEGGQLPESLSGFYNNIADAQRAIDDWTEGYTRNKIYPKAPKNDIPQRSVVKDGEAKDERRV